MENKRNGFLTWLNKYPIKALILTFIIIIPVIFVSVFLGTTFKNNTRFHFETDGSDKPIYLNTKDLITDKDLEKYLDLSIDLKSIELPLENEVGDDVSLEKGRYIFDVSYDIVNTKASYKFTWMLDTKWEDKRSTPRALNITDKTSERSIEYNYNLPFRKYGIFKVNRPYLFLKIDVIHDEIIPGLNTNDETLYYRIDLNEFKPDVSYAR